MTKITNEKSRTASSTEPKSPGWKSFVARNGRWLAAGTAATALIGGALFNRAGARRAEARTPPAGSFVEVDGARIHYIDRGDGPVVVLLHGNGVLLQDYEVSGVLGLGCAAAIAATISMYRSGGGDGALRWVVVCIAMQLGVVPLLAAIGLVRQVRAQRVAHGSLRAQLRWLLYGHALSALPVLVSVPIALADVEKFLIIRYQPFVIAVAVLW